MQDKTMDKYKAPCIRKTVCACAAVHVLQCMWRSEELVLSFYHVGPRDGPLVIKLEDRRLHSSEVCHLGMNFFFSFIPGIDTSVCTRPS